MNNTEKEMIAAIYKNRNLLSTTYEVAIPNCFTQHDNEADLFFIRKSGFCDEIEIKTSRSDLLADKRKIVFYRKYDSLNQADKAYAHESAKTRPAIAPYQKHKHSALESGEMKCNYFWYALKEGVGGTEDIPKFAGLLIVKDDGSVRLIRSPDRLHRRKLDFEQRYKFAKLLHYRYWG